MKRPGVEAFLLEMGRRYEVVIYTDEAAMYADPVINKIDPNRAVTYRLYRQDTQVSFVVCKLTGFRARLPSPPPCACADA